MTHDKLLGARDSRMGHDQRYEDDDGSVRCASASASVRVRDDHDGHVSLEDFGTWFWRELNRRNDRRSTEDRRGPGLPPNFDLDRVVS